MVENHPNVASLFDTVTTIMNCVDGSCKHYNTLRAIEVEKVVTQLESSDIASGKGKNQELGIKRAGTTC